MGPMDGQMKPNGESAIPDVPSGNNIDLAHGK
jgi:hypothetical protein